MAGVTVKVQDSEFQRKIAAIQNGLADARPLMEVWGEIAYASMIENFEQGGRPPWRPLSPVTIGLKGHDRILIGRTGNLRRLTVKPGSQSVEIGTSPAARDYAAIQQFGGQAGRNKKVTIPARPYLVLQDEDVEEMTVASRK